MDDTLSVHHRIVLGCALVLGLVLRLYSAYTGDGFQYYGINDEVSAYQYILAFLAGEPYAQYLGQPVFAGTQVPGPLWTLYGVLLYKLGGESIANAILCSAVINSFVVYLVYILARRFVDGSSSLLTALLFAVLPWPLYHASGLYNPTVAALLGSLLFLALWRVCSEAGSKYIFFACLILAAIPQFHMVGIFYIPVVLLLFVLSPGINWRWLLFGVIAGFSLYLPYLIGEMHHGWSNTQKLFSEDTGFSWGWLKILTSPAALLASVPGSVAPDDTSTFKELGDRFFGSYFIFFAISVLSLLLALALYFSYLKVFSGAMLAVVKRRHEAIAKHRATLFIGGLIFLPLVLFALTGHSYTSRYAMLIMPLLFLLPAIMVKRSSDAGLKQWFFLAVAALVIYNSYLAVVTYHYKAQLLTDSSYVMPSFKKLESMSAAVNSDAGEQARARLQLSMSIRALTGRYDKIYSVYPEYVVTEQRYKYEKSDSLPVMDYLVQLPQEVLQPGSKLIYRDNNVVITTSALSHN
jgi:4-amino-4-deoxy-L-arabinose transferase-like glycosyltransferase